MNRTIEVYTDWSKGQPARLGALREHDARNVIFDFTFDNAALANPALPKTTLDPDLGTFAGVQYPKNGRSLFGMFADSCPDRWGETLIRRHFDRQKRAGLIPKTTRLTKTDFLLGVHDAFRSGALRYKTTPSGAFLDDSDSSAAPPFVRLRELEAASRALESDPEGNRATDEWLAMLLAPGASLGGARPKATVVDSSGHLWIAKFPSIKDGFDVGAWELVVARLAQRCALRIPECEARTFASAEHTFLVRRFDRDESGGRIHFASAMTLTGHQDGDNAALGASYLEIAEVIISQGAAPREDLVELWSRIVFNICVSNTDDHLRNHGFLLDPQAGWRLAPAYDVNPNRDSRGLSLNIDENDNALDLDLARSVAPYFRIKDDRAKHIIDATITRVREWPSIATSLGIKQREQADMADAFALADN